MEGDNIASATVTVNVANTESFRVLSDCVIDFLKDERINQEVREEYCERVASLIEVKEGV